MNIHPTAIVHPKAELADDVEVGPYSVIGEHVRIGRGTRLVAHVYVDGWTEIGERCQFYPYASIGTPPQHLQYKGEPTKVVIGHDNIFREYVTVNRGTVQGGGLTAIGNHNFLMAYTHVAHDCRLGNHILMANVATLAGHITIGDHAILGGLVLLHLPPVGLLVHLLALGVDGVGRDEHPAGNVRFDGAGGHVARDG